MQQINFRRIFTIVAILSLLLYFSFSWLNMMTDFYQKTGSDFIGLYNFGRIYQTKGIQSIYDIQEQEKVEEQVVGHPVNVIFYTHLPFMAPIARLIVNEDYDASFQRWAVILLLLNIINVSLLVRLVDKSKFTKQNWLFLCAGAFLFDPTFSGFMNGQDIALLLLGVILWMWGLFEGKDFLAGLGLSLATLRPQLALFLALPFFFHRRNVFWGFALGSLILGTISVGLLRLDGTIKFVESIRYIEGTIWYQQHAFDMPTISGILRRNFTMLNPMLVKNVVWICYLLGIVGFCAWWYRSQEINEQHMGLLVLAAIFLVPYAHYHELTLLLIPIFCLIRILQKDGTVPQYYLAILPLVVSWLSALGFLGSGVMKFSIVNFVMLSLAYLLMTHGKLARRLPQPATP